MKYQSLTIAATMLVFAALLMSIGCSPATPPSNQTNVKPANAANVETASAAIDKDDPCDKPNTQAKVDALNIRIDQRFKDDEKFRAQYVGENGQVPSFRFWVVNNNGIIELRIKGSVSGKDKNGNSKLEGILDIIDGYLDKTSCIQKVKFVPGAITSATELAPTSDGFEWIFCESPQVSCPGGVCADNPPGCSGMGSSNSNANSPANSNVNTNGSVNPNTNRP